MTRNTTQTRPGRAYDARDHSSAELLATLLGDAPRQPALHAASALLESFGSLPRLLLASHEELCTVAGVGRRRATRVLAALELGRRAVERQSSSRLEMHPLHSQEDVEQWARPRLAHLPHEEVWLLSVDARSRLIRADRVAQGGVRSCSLLPQDVLRPAVRNGATGAILVHNHPSGDPRPSADDVFMTQALQRAFESLGIALLDHVVIGATHSTSIADYAGLRDLAA